MLISRRIVDWFFLFAVWCARLRTGMIRVFVPLTVLLPGVLVWLLNTVPYYSWCSPGVIPDPRIGTVWEFIPPTRVILEYFFQWRLFPMLELGNLTLTETIRMFVQLQGYPFLELRPFGCLFQSLTLVQLIIIRFPWPWKFQDWTGAIRVFVLLTGLILPQNCLLNCSIWTAIHWTALPRPNIKILTGLPATWSELSRTWTLCPSD